MYEIPWAGRRIFAGWQRVDADGGAGLLPYCGAERSVVGRRRVGRVRGGGVGYGCFSLRGGKAFWGTGNVPVRVEQCPAILTHGLAANGA